MMTLGPLLAAAVLIAEVPMNDAEILIVTLNIEDFDRYRQYRRAYAPRRNER